MSLFRMFSLTAVFLVSFCLSAIALNICGDCGYELEESSRFCSHCGKNISSESSSLKQVSDSEISAVSEPAVPEVRDYAAEELEYAVKLYIENNDRELYGQLLENAFIISRLVAGTPDATVLKITEARKRSRPLTREGRSRCAVCKGEGSVERKSVPLGSADESKGLEVKCRFCKGEGGITRTLLVSELKLLQSYAAKKYNDLQQSRRYVELFPDFWLPADLAASITVKQESIARRSRPHHCTKCAGTGRTDCGKCGSLGFVKCSDNGCFNGLVIPESTREKKSAVIAVYCVNCHGKARSVCGECSGRGKLVCSECEGRGEGEFCGKCKGAGLKKCRKCSGLGKYKEKKCVKCSGNGVQFCSSCLGSGRD